ncbi:FIVAR domain-containing protein [Bifidobacterium avesanii]|nr:FIVAR domain-containing protein [Bifidobacterium avesanii]
MLLSAAAGPMTALAAGETVPSETPVGYTDKTARKEAGRASVKAGALAVKDGSAPTATGVTYYVDSRDGDDSNAGTSVDKPWKSLDKVNAITFQPGDRILLKAGSVWNATGDAVAKEAYDYATAVGKVEDNAAPTFLLHPLGSGTAEAPIVLSSYGDGDAPELNGRGVVNDTVQLMNQQHWDISNLEITNVTDNFDATKFQPKSDNGQIPGTENEGQGDLRGLHIAGEKAGELKGFTIHNLFIHDVSGVTWSVSKAGIDRSKRTGGILFEGLLGDATEATVLSDIDVYGNTIANTSFANIVFKQASGNVSRGRKNAPGWGDRYGAGKVSNTGAFREDASWQPHNDITVSGNYMTNRDTQYGWDSMYLTSVKGATVEDNVIDASGVSGIEMYFADNVVVRNNDVGEMQRRTGAADTNAIDPDTDTTNILIEHNYVHDSGEGILLCGFDKGSSSVTRYNVIRDIERNYINPHGSNGVNVIYNNLMINDIAGNANGKIRYFATSGSSGSVLKSGNVHYMANNVFINNYDKTTETVLLSGNGVTYQNNAYYGVKMVAPETDTAPITVDPQLKGDVDADLANAMIGAGTSPLIAAGSDVDLSKIASGFKASGAEPSDQTAATVDFFGAPIASPVNVGATSYAVPQDKSVLAGAVLNADGTPVANATVRIGDQQTVTSGTNGRFTVEVEPGEYTLIPSAEDYESGKAVKIAAKAGAVTIANVTLGRQTKVTGTVAGTVTALGEAVPGAVVTVSKDGAAVATVTTDADGKYTIAVEVGEGYTVSVAKGGYSGASRDGVAVAKGVQTVADLAMTRIAEEVKTVIDEDFDDEPTGAFTKSADGTLTALTNAGVGTVAVEEASADAGATGKYLHINKTGVGKGSVLGIYNAEATNLTGTVTIEARIQRTTTNGEPNQIAMYAYDESGWKAASPASSNGPTATFGIKGGKLFTHKGPNDKTIVTVADAEANTWYDVKYVANVEANTGELFVNGKSVWSGGMRTKVDSLDRFLLYTDGSNTGDLLIDSFKVTQGAPTSDADTTLTALDVTSDSIDDPVTLTRDGDAFAGTVGAFDETATVKAAALNAGAKVFVNGVEATADSPAKITLAASNDDQAATIDTTVPVKVVAADGTTSKEYSLTVSRTNPSQLTQLRDLSVEGYEFAEPFDRTKQGAENPIAVKGEVANDVKSVTVRVTRGWANQTVKVNNQKVDGDTAEVTLADGKNTITVNADSYTGEALDYVIEVTRAAAPAPDADPDLTTVDTEGFDQQTDPANYGFGDQYVTVADGKLTITGMDNGTAVGTQLSNDLVGQTKSGVTFLWSATTGAKAKAGVQVLDEYGRLVFALTGAKGSELRYGTVFNGQGASGVAATNAATAAVEPTWTTVKADPSKTYRVRVVLDSAAKKVAFTVAPSAGGDAVIDGNADTTASSLAQLVLANYYGGAANTQTLDDIALRVADTTPDLPLKGKMVYAFGDSIVAGHKYKDASFATFAARAEGMSIQRFAKNGAAIAYVDGKTTAKDLWISYQIEHAPADAPDVVLFDGGTNDAENIRNGAVTVDDYKKAFADTIKQIQGKWPTAKIVFTAVPKLYTRDYDIQAQLHEAQTAVCKELGVTLADAYTAGGDGITEANKAQYSFANVSSVTGLPEAGTNTGSGTHPNFEGIRTFYLPTVTAALRAAFTETPAPEPADKAALNAAIEAAGKLVESDYTAESWKVFASALSEARTVADDEVAGQAAVDAAVSALKTAQDALAKAEPEPTPEPTDKSVLQAAVDAAAKFDAASYTEASWQAFAVALDSARVVLADSAASQDAVNGAVAALLDAESKLEAASAPEPEPSPVVRDVLNALIAAAEKLSSDDYQSGWIEFKSALEGAKSVAADADASQKDVDAAAVALVDAQAALVRKPAPSPQPAPVSKDSLNAVVAAAKMVKTDAYTQDSADAFKAAIAAAEKVAADDDATQAEVDAALKSLVEAQAALVRKPVAPSPKPEPTPVDRSVLDAAVAVAGKLTESDYTADSWSVFAKALADAKAVAKDADQTAVDKAAVDLIKAQGALVKVETAKPDTKPETPQTKPDDGKDGQQQSGAKPDATPGADGGQDADRPAADKTDGKEQGKVPAGSGDVKQSDDAKQSADAKQPSVLSRTGVSVGLLIALAVILLAGGVLAALAVRRRDSI